MKMSVTQLRSNIYKVIDDVLESGQPVQIQRGDQQVWITPVPPSSEKAEKPKRRFRLEDRLVKRENVTTGNDEDFVHIDWSKEWNTDNDLLS